MSLIVQERKTMVKKDINVKVQYVECGRNKCKRQAIAESCNRDMEAIAVWLKNVHLIRSM